MTSDLRLLAAGSPWSSVLPKLAPSGVQALERMCEIAADAFPLDSLSVEWWPCRTFAVRAKIATRCDDLATIDGLREWAMRLDGELYLYPPEETARGSRVYMRKLQVRASIGDAEVRITGKIATEQHGRTEPERVWRRRVKGWRMPTDAVYVGRGTKWGNPFRVGTTLPSGTVVADRATAVELYKAYLAAHPELVTDAVTQLRGKSLACWCPLADTDGVVVPCHADVLLQVARGDVTALTEAVNVR